MRHSPAVKAAGAIRRKEKSWPHWRLYWGDNPGQIFGWEQDKDRRNTTTGCSDPSQEHLNWRKSCFVEKLRNQLNVT